MTSRSLKSSAWQLGQVRRASATARSSSLSPAILEPERCPRGTRSPWLIWSIAPIWGPRERRIPRKESRACSVVSSWAVPQILQRRSTVHSRPDSWPKLQRCRRAQRERGRSALTKVERLRARRLMRSSSERTPHLPLFLRAGTAHGGDESWECASPPGTPRRRPLCQGRALPARL